MKFLPGYKDDQKIREQNKNNKVQDYREINNVWSEIFYDNLGFKATHHKKPVQWLIRVDSFVYILVTRFIFENHRDKPLVCQEQV